VLLLLAWRFPRARGVGIEAQAASVDLARRSLGWNGVRDRCSVRLADLRRPEAIAGIDHVGLVTGTPPYLQPGRARVSARPQRAACTFEQRGGIESYCEAAARLLAPAGVFVACAGAGQRPQAERGAAAAGLSIEGRLDVVPRRGKPVLLSVYVMRRGSGRATGAAGTLVVREASGDWTPDFRTLRTEMGLPSGPEALRNVARPGAPR